MANAVWGANAALGAAAARLAGSSVKFRSSVKVKALTTNTGVVYVGFDNTVSASNGFPLGPGQEMTIGVDQCDADVTNIWCFASVAAQAAAWSGT